MPERIDTRLAKSSDLIVALQGSLIVDLLLGLLKGCGVGLSVVFDPFSPSTKIGYNLFPLMLLEHGDFYATAPTVEQPCHGNRKT
jgi:hypothetical protein